MPTAMLVVSTPASAQDVRKPAPVVAAPAPPPAPAADPQTARTSQNAVNSAEDAFGVVIGREQLGLYSANGVRGFSPIAAGNARIDGLYFDPVYTPNNRVLASTKMRVGLAAQGYPFVAPTGIVDYQLRHPGSSASASALARASNWGSLSFEADGVVPVTRTVSLGLGGEVSRGDYGDGTTDHAATFGVSVSWRPSADLEVMPFWTRILVRDGQPAPVYVVRGEGLPPPVPGRRFDGPFNPLTDLDGDLFGVLARYSASPRLTVSAGVFSTTVSNPLKASSLRIGLTADGRFNQLLVVDPSPKATSKSGEIRVTREFGTLGRIHLSLRARDRAKRYGGSDVVDLGPQRIGDAIDGRSSGFRFSATSLDRIEQWSAGVAYEGRWRGGALGVGVTRTSYRKTAALPGIAPIVSRADPWLLSVTAAKGVTPWLGVFGSYVQGLEESPAAPSVAVNRGEPVPAVRTRQVDAGVRIVPVSGMTLVVSAFDLQRPYFDLDRSSRYRQLGTVTNRGIEASLVGKVTPRLNVVAGNVMQWPTLAGDAVTSGAVGDRPTGMPRRITILNLDWRLPVLEGASIDAGLSSTSSRPSTTSGRTYVPARSTLSLGGRYRFKVAGRQVLARVAISNLTDVRGYSVSGAGVYVPYDGRSATFYLSADF